MTLNIKILNMFLGKEPPTDMSEQPGEVEGVPAQGRFLELDDL